MFILAVGFQLLVLLLLILFKFSVLIGGNAVLLKIRPVDPRDPFRGDYVTFTYADISRGAFQFNYEPVRNGDRVYVPLERSGGSYWRVSGEVGKVKPKEGLFIKGVVESGGVDIVDELAGSTKRSYRTVTIKYGIEEYFIPEGAGHSMVFRGDKNFAKVMVDENGNAVIKQIFVDNKPWP